MMITNSLANSNYPTSQSVPPLDEHKSDNERGHRDVKGGARVVDLASVRNVGAQWDNVQNEQGAPLRGGVGDDPVRDMVRPGCKTYLFGLAPALAVGFTAYHQLNKTTDEVSVKELVGEFDFDRYRANFTAANIRPDKVSRDACSNRFSLKVILPNPFPLENIEPFINQGFQFYVDTLKNKLTLDLVNDDYYLLFGVLPVSGARLENFVNKIIDDLFELVKRNRIDLGNAAVDISGLGTCTK